MRIVVPVPICQAEGYVKPGIFGIALDLTLNLAYRPGGFLGWLLRSRRHYQGKSENDNGPPSSDRLDTNHWSGSISRSCKREVASSSVRRDFAISSCLSA